MRRIPNEERIEYFDQTVELLSNAFPNTWNTVTSHQFQAWDKCRLCLPHVNSLMIQAKQYDIASRKLRQVSFSSNMLIC